jgi:hypothetical protein
LGILIFRKFRKKWKTAGLRAEMVGFAYIGWVLVSGSKPLEKFPFFGNVKIWKFCQILENRSPRIGLGRSFVYRAGPGYGMGVFDIFSNFWKFLNF